MTRLALLFPTLLALSACGTGSEFNRSVTMLRGMLQTGSAPASNLRDRLTPQIIAQANAPVVFTAMPDYGGAQILYAQEMRNGDATSWRSPTGEGLVFERGVLQATRGFGGDLMTADLSDVHQALAGRTARGERVHRHLDGENHIVAYAYICDYTRQPDQTSAYFRDLAVTRVDETCTGLTRAFQNRYWIDGRGKIVRSSEWAGQTIGRINREQLAD